MSTADPPVSAAGVGLGYGIAIAVSFLVLISTIMLASYICVRLKTTTTSGGSRHNNNNSNDNDVVVRDYRYQLHHQLRRDNSNSSSSAAAVEFMAGMDSASIESLPRILLGESKRLPRPNNGGPCSICLSDYRPKDTLRLIPECNHCFHARCVDEWLRMTATCPLCRTSPGPATPVASPLLELVPLAIHGAR